MIIPSPTGPLRGPRWLERPAEGNSPAHDVRSRPSSAPEGHLLPTAEGNRPAPRRQLDGKSRSSDARTHGQPPREGRTRLPDCLRWSFRLVRAARLVHEPEVPAKAVLALGNRPDWCATRMNSRNVSEASPNMVHLPMYQTIPAKRSRQWRPSLALAPPDTYHERCFRDSGKEA